MTVPSQYQISYTAVSRGQHKLHVQVREREIRGSPFTITVYPDPTQLPTVRTVTGLKGPYGIAINSYGEAVVSECLGHRVSIIDMRGQTIQTFGSLGDGPHHMDSPAGIAIDKMDNIYVSSEHKLQKFTSSGKLIKCVGQRGRKAGEFDNPRGVTLYNNQLYVCDRNNNRIQVFDLDLNFVGFINFQFNRPVDIKFDTTGNMYVADCGNNKVQVMNLSDNLIRSLDQEGEGRLNGPTGLHIADRFVYVSDVTNNCIAVYI